jgi:ribosomal protein S18 acetylase RimI-like enzyme
MSMNPFDPADAATVAGWAATADEAVRWCGHRGWPVPEETVRSWSTEDGVGAFGLFRQGRIIGYGELWVDHDEAEVELARLIIDPRHRGQGLGRTLVAALLERAPYPDVFLRVHPDNDLALRCYAGAGFVRVDPDREATWNAPQPLAYVWLERRAREPDDGAGVAA